MTTGGNSTRQGAYVQANGLDIYYEEYGSGEPLLLVHGGFNNNTMWDIHIPIFAQHFRVIAPDSRGHGRTKNPIKTLSYPMMAGDMAAFVQALGLQQPLVCGYSDGGQIALEMALHYPHIAKAYVAGGTVYSIPEETLQIAKEWGLEGPGIVDFEKFQQALPGFERRLRERHDTFQGDGYWKSYLEQFSYLAWTAIHYSDEELK
jgi:pimeloyl-ACP methyl ester carboxylesterase